MSFMVSVTFYINIKINQSISQFWGLQGYNQYNLLLWSDFLGLHPYLLGLQLLCYTSCLYSTLILSSMSMELFRTMPIYFPFTN